MVITLKEGLLLKSIDGEYVYNIFAFQPDCDTMTLDIMDANLSSVTTKHNYPVKLFMDQIKAGTVVPFKENENLGMKNEQTE
jgi:hypothetical protein